MLNWAEVLAARMDRGEVPTTARAEVQAIGLGPVVLVGVPGELFSSLGARIKALGVDARPSSPGIRTAILAISPMRRPMRRADTRCRTHSSTTTLRLALAPAARRDRGRGGAQALRGSFS